ncbi:Satratoxin biosynthesis SC1 cluster protein 4 [Pseudocercospora fuligena]|uniref:Satratoxin biosynthesis SC1 cluster protein 4 n=1 Tax=Pseudocercospora fuligena TaxID=685502 RepID=A0A8H6VE46_9PEZI|nr:Satratoxin biosynthesis SC1 cluster protein 4 [Pseudocercospora fuligena]
MRSFWFLTSTLVAAALAQDSTAGDDAKARQAAAAKLLPTIPKCGLTCLETAVLASPCSFTDLDCSCNNATIAEQVAVCALGSCTIKESLSMKNITETMCGKPVRDRTHVIAYSGIGGMAVAIAAYLVRIFSKIHMPSQGLTFFTELWWDDLVMTIGMMFLIPLCSISVPISSPGLGRDVWTLTYHEITRTLKLLYADELLYVASLGTVKIALLLTYLRFFSVPKFRQLVYIMIGVNVCYMLAFILGSAFQCKPISLTWTQWDGEHTGSCVSFNGLGWSSAICNILIDLVVIGMPMPLLYSMKLNNKKKFMVMLMFGVGFFVTVISILRLHILVSYGKAKNFTWDYVPLGYWSKLEIQAAVFCACMPAMRNLFRRFSPKLMGSTRGGDTTAQTGLSGRTSPWMVSLDRRVHDRTWNEDDNEDLGTLATSDYGKSVDTEVGLKTMQSEVKEQNMRAD